MTIDEQLGNKSRIVRIQRLSRLLKYCLIFYVSVTFASLLYHIATRYVHASSRSPVFEFAGGVSVYVGAADLLTLFAVISTYRLLGLYEQGQIFSPANAKQIRNLGSLAVAYGLLRGFALFLFRPPQEIFSIGKILESLLFSPWLFVGLFVVVITWIMDEGNRINEELDLTI